MTSEGGGKLKQKRAHANKPYDRPKSIFSRMTDAVRGILNPSWVTGLISSQPAVTDTASNCNNNAGDHSNATLRRNSLNSPPGPSGVTFPHVNDKRQSIKPRIPLDNEHEPFWNPAALSRDRSTLTFAEHPDSHTPLLTPPSFVSGYLAEAAAGPSTSTPFDGAKECVSRRNGERERVNPGSSPSAVLTPASRQLYAKLSGIGKYTSIAQRKEELESGTNLAVGDSQSECSEESISTSGCSSMVPHPDKREYQRDVLQLGKPALETLSENLQTSILSQNKSGTGWDQTIAENGQTSRNSSSFLFSELNADVSRSARPQPITMGSKPQFKPYLLGSPTWMENSVLQTRPSNLSFNGKATYGFGSARKVRINSSAPYTTAPPSSRRHVQVKPVGNADLDVMSNTTKRILETLEKMSTPLMDAKKIPTNKSDSILDTPLTFTSTYRRWPSLANKSTSQVSKVEMASAASVSRGPPINKLMTPGSISVTKMFPKPNASPSVRVSPAKNLNTSKESKGSDLTTAFHPQGNEAKKASGKMKSSRQREHYTRNVAECDDEPHEMPALPSFALPLKTLPVFDFFPQSHGLQLPKKKEAVKFASPSVTTQKPVTPISTPFVSNNAVSMALSTAALSTPTAAATTAPMANCSVAKQNSATISFLFSTPAQVKESVEDCSDNTKLSDSDVQFEFRPPDSVGNKEDALPKESFSTSAATTSNFVFKSPSSPVVSLKQKTEFSPEQPIKHSDVPVASELKSGSVLDLLAKFAETNQKNANDGKTSSTKVGSLTEKSDKIPAVIELDSKPAVSTASIGFGNSFKPAVGNWECQSCMVSNKAEATKCVACETTKPTAKSAPAAATVPLSAAESTVTPTAPFSGFGDRFNSGSDTWECPSCMLRVKQDLLKCAACETPKPGSKPSTPVSIFGNKAPCFSTTKNVTGPKVAAGVDPSMWECDTCLVKNQPSALKCIACESAKPGASSLPAAASGFKFGFTTSSTTPSPQVFGTNLTSGATASGDTTFAAIPVFKFGMPATLQSSSTTGNSTVSTGFSFASKSTEKDATAAPPAPFKFGLPTIAEKDTSKAAASFKFPETLPGTEIQAQKESAAAIEKKPDFQPENSTPKDVPVSVATSAPPPAYGLSFQPKTDNATAESNVALQKLVEKTENPLLFKTVAPAMPTVPSVPVVPALSTQPFTFGSLKPAPESKFAFSPVTTSLPAVPSVPSAAAPSSGFSFKFGGDSSAPALTAATQPATFSFSDTKPTSKETSTAPATGGFPFTFSAGGKRSADSLDEGSATKKVPLGSGLPTFGSFSSAGNAAANTTPTSGFSFGSAPAPSRTPVFGALSSGGEKPAASNTFTFGASSASPNPSPAPPAFNAPSSLNAQPLFGAKQPTPFQPTPQPTLSFGAPNPLTTSAPAFGAKTNTSTFSFSSQNPAGGSAGNSIPAFGTSAAPSAALPAFGSTPSGPVFGAAPTPSFGVFGAAAQAPANPAPAPVAPSSGFNFGLGSNFQFGGQTQASAGVFQFSGNQNTNTETQASNQGFAFGQLASTNQQQPTQQSGFLGQAGFPMSFPPVPTLSSTNPFEIASKAGGRTIKKAKRRTHQK